MVSPLCYVRRRSTCASAQSDQHLCCSLPRHYDISSIYIINFMTLASFFSWAYRFESYLVENPEDRFSPDGAHMGKFYYLTYQVKIYNLDGYLCCSLPRQYDFSSIYMSNFKTLANFFSWADRFESYLVENPEDRFSRDEAHMRKFLLFNLPS